MKSIEELMNLKGRSVLITGGAGHIGRAMGDAVAELGASVAVIDLNPDACSDTATRLAEKHGVKSEGFPVDLAEETAVRELPGQVAERLGGEKLAKWWLGFQSFEPKTYNRICPLTVLTYHFPLHFFQRLFYSY